MKVLTAMLLLGPMAAFAFMWSQCYLLQNETGRLREENRLLREQVQYTAALNREFANSLHQADGPKALGPKSDAASAGPRFQAQPRYR